MPRVVRVIKTGETVYRQEPDFEPGLGIKNACILLGFKKKELEEVEITQEEYDAEINVEFQEKEKEKKIKEEMDSILREQAIQNLKSKGLL